MQFTGRVVNANWHNEFYEELKGHVVCDWARIAYDMAIAATTVLDQETKSCRWLNQPRDHPCVYLTEIMKLVVSACERVCKLLFHGTRTLPSIYFALH